MRSLFCIACSGSRCFIGVRAVTRLVAEDGESVEIEATVFVSPEWREGNFIGYSGLLERIRFAVDPDTNSFIFGAL